MAVVGNLVANPLPVTGTITTTGIKGTTTEVDFSITQNAFITQSFTYTVPAGFFLEVSFLKDTGGFLLISGTNRGSWTAAGSLRVPAGIIVSASIPPGGGGSQAGIYGMLFTNT
jgi:hypothetical protein